MDPARGSIAPGHQEVWISGVNTPDDHTILVTVAFRNSEYFTSGNRKLTGAPLVTTHFPRAPMQFHQHLQNCHTASVAPSQACLPKNGPLPASRPLACGAIHQ